MLKILLSFFVLLLFNQSLMAHGPSRQKVSLKLDINAPASEVWKIVSNFDEFTWNEEVEKSESNGNKVGSERLISFKNGSKVKQKLEKINTDKMMVRQLKYYYHQRKQSVYLVLDVLLMILPLEIFLP